VKFHLSEILAVVTCRAIPKPNGDSTLGQDLMEYMLGRWMPWPTKQAREECLTELFRQHPRLRGLENAEFEDIHVFLERMIGWFGEELEIQPTKK